ncbi:hypothetical protein ACHQM5_007314 [Ranunculus cassubicifolius]
MSKGCINGVLDMGKYSSPVPAIGLYITAGSAVCMLFMLFDIVSAFHQRKHRWMPCRLFSLNSVTLTLLSICSKISLDITSQMPSAYDQLAKLTGTTLICVSMCFFHPSIGGNRGSECLTNMVALSIFVITVVVNVSIQISTGLIYVFVNEHITVMGCMLVLLFMLWVSTMNINNWKDLFLDYNKNLMTKGDGSMLQRLKICYIYGVNSDPQLKICTDLSHVGVAAFCMIAFGVLAEAAIASLVTKQLKFCPGISDYDWSMQRIVQFQILTIIIGCFAISFRWFNFASKPSTTIFGEEAINTEIRTNPVLGASVWDMCCMYLKKLHHFLGMQPMVIFLIPMLVISNICCFCCLHHAEIDDDESSLEEYKSLVGEGEMKIDKWIVCKAVTDITKWMKAGRIRSAKNLSEFLSRTSPSPLLLALNLGNFYPDDDTGIEVSSLSMALIMKIMTVSLPVNLTKSLQHTFSEAYEIIEFIETRIMPASRKTRMKTKLAKAVLIGNGFNVLLPNIVERSAFVDEFHSLSDLGRARIILRELKNAMPYSALAEDVGAIADLINDPEVGTIQDMYNHAEQMFVDMMHSFLVQFPNAIFKYVVESPAEEFEERVALVLKLLLKVECLEAQVQWLFPGDCGILSLMTPQVPATVSNSIGVSENVGQDVPSNLDDVIIEV